MQQYLFAFESPVQFPTTTPTPALAPCPNGISGWLHSPPHKPGLNITESNDFKTAIDGLLAVVVPGFTPFPCQEQGSTEAELAPLLWHSCKVTEMNQFLFLMDCENCMCPRASETEISIAQGNAASKRIHFSFLAAGGRKSCCIHGPLSSQLNQSLMSLLLARAQTGPGSLGDAHPCLKASRDLPNSSPALTAPHGNSVTILDLNS